MKIPQILSFFCFFNRDNMSLVFNSLCSFKFFFPHKDKYSVTEHRDVFFFLFFPPSVSVI